MTRHCYDTAILVDVLRDVASTVRLLRRHEREQRATTALTAYELALGATTPARRRAALELIGTLDVVPIDSQVAWIAGEEMREMRRQGHEPPLRDLLIGVAAREAGFALYTTDRSFPALEGLDLHVV